MVGKSLKRNFSQMSQDSNAEDENEIIIIKKVIN